MLRRYPGQFNVLQDGKLSYSWLGISGNSKQRRAAIRRLRRNGYTVTVCNGHI